MATQHASDHPLSLVRAMCEAAVRGDAEAMLTVVADDVVVHIGGANLLAGTHVGRPAMLAMLAASAERLGPPQLDLKWLSVNESAVLAVWEARFTPSGREPFVQPEATLYRVAGGRVVEIWTFDGEQELVDAALSN